jgi:hypothetical protein
MRTQDSSGPDLAALRRLDTGFQVSSLAQIIEKRATFSLKETDQPVVSSVDRADSFQYLEAGPTTGGDAGGAAVGRGGETLRQTAAHQIAVTGTANLGSNTVGIAERISTIGTTADWLDTITVGGDPTQNLSLNSSQLNLSGTTLDIAGSADTTNLGGGPGSLLFGQLDAPTGNVNNWGSLVYYGGGAIVIGNDIAPTSVGGADIAIQIQLADGRANDIFGLTDGTPASSPALWTFGNQDSDPRATMNSITVDASDNMIMTGTIVHRLQQSLLLDRAYDTGPGGLLQSRPQHRRPRLLLGRHLQRCSGQLAEQRARRGQRRWPRHQRHRG